MNLTQKRNLSKILYYRYFDLLQSSTYLGDSPMIIFSKQMMKIILPFIKSGELFNLSDAELKKKGIPLVLILDKNELETKGNIAYIEEYKSNIPNWLHEFISPQYFNLKKLQEYIVSNSITCKNDMKALLNQRSHLSEFEKDLYHVLTYMDETNFPVFFINKFDSYTELRNSIYDIPLRGTFHNHSLFSDGVLSIKEISNLANFHKYEYIGLSDHSYSTLLGIDSKGLSIQHKEIDKHNCLNSSVKLLKSIECEILKDGSLDLSKDDLQKFDYTIIGIHSHFNMSKKSIHRRLIRAIENEYSDILAHPTCRLFGSKPGFRLDMNYIIDACVKNNVIIEINGNWKRLDLDPKHIKYAVNKGAMFELAADVHFEKDFFRINNAITISEALVVPKERIINLLTYDEVVSFFERQHKIKRRL